MKTNVSRFVVTLLCLALVLSSAFFVSASRYKSSIVSESFSGSSLFVCPGDVDFNGSIEDADVTSLASTLLSCSSSGYNYADLVAQNDAHKYKDVTGDGTVDILDVVQAEMNMVDGKYVSGGTMAFDGKCVYSVPLVPMMNTGATYRITYKYKAYTPLTVTFNNAGTVRTYNNAVTNSWQTAQYDVTTPLTKGSSSQFDLKVQGDGEFDNFKIERVNMDNELVAP